MSTYLYTAKDQQGQTKVGSLEAANQHELAATLRQQGLVLISAESADQRGKSTWFGLKNISKIFGRVSLVEKMMFTRNLAVMIGAGLSLNQALVALAEQTKSPKLKKIINRLEDNLRQGQSFSKSLSQYPKVFDQLYINMVRVGETSGNLDQVLEILAEQMRKDHELISRIKGAMMYPAVIVTAMIGIGIMMMVVVVPKLTGIFAELEIELPLTTRIVIGVSNFFQSNLILGLILLVSFFVFIKIIMKISLVKSICHKIYLFLPIFGSLIRKINSARFARTLSSLIESGVAIVSSLEIIAGTLTNIHFKKTLRKAAQEVQKGTELSETLTEYKNLYTPMVIQMLKVGEKTGNLSEILKSLADFYEAEIDNTTKNLSSIIEPIIMIVIGAAVGFFAVSMVQPMYSMVGGI